MKSVSAAAVSSTDWLRRIANAVSSQLGCSRRPIIMAQIGYVTTPKSVPTSKTLWITLVTRLDYVGWYRVG